MLSFEIGDFWEGEGEYVEIYKSAWHSESERI